MSRAKKIAVAIYENFEPCGRFPIDLELRKGLKGNVQDKAHHDKGDVNILEYHKEDIARGETSIRISHAAGQDNKDQKEIPLKSVHPRRGRYQGEP
jgi:hypothetical protein